MSATATKPKEEAKAKEEPKQPDQPKAKEIPFNPAATVAKQISGYIERGTLILPPDYSPDNALKKAWLILQELTVWVDGGNVPVLIYCTPNSIVNSLTSMVIQALDPSKKQCYFIAYQRELQCQRSYFGDLMLAQRVRPDIEPYWGIVYEDDVFEYQVVRGRKYITKHEQKLENIDPKRIKAAFAGMEDSFGADLGCEIMTFEQIEESWRKSKTYGRMNRKGEPIETPHDGQPDQMAMRTAIRRYFKPVINKSTDKLLLQAVRLSDIEETSSAFNEQVASDANADFLEVPSLEARNELVEMPDFSVHQEPEKIAEPAMATAAPAPAAQAAQPTLDEEEGPDYS